MYEKIKPCEPNFASHEELWAAYNKMWEDQVRGKGIKVYEEHCMAKLRACIVGDPFAVYIPHMDVEVSQLLEDSCDEEMKQYFRNNAKKNMRDVDPERYEQICEATYIRDEIYEKHGIITIRNKIGWHPPEVVHFNAAMGGGGDDYHRFLSPYGGSSWTMAGRNLIACQCAGPVRGFTASARAAMLALVEEDPESRLVAIPGIEPNPTVTGPGLYGFDLVDIRYMPGNTLLFGYGAPSVDKVGDHSVCPAGNPRGHDFLMSILEPLGIKSEIWWYDSNHNYHQDGVMLNVVEGTVGLPDDGKNGSWIGLPECIKGYDILPIPPEEVALGACNGTSLGDGRVFMFSKCVKSMEVLDKAGYEPIPIPYDILWETFGSGIDCSDANIWREND